MNRFDPEQNKQSASIRSEIDQTRQRMNSTIDALSERLKGRHLVDEVLGLFRSGNGSDGGSSVKTKVAETTSATVHAVVDAVKAHPLPILVMGAGLAWLIYEKERKARTPSEPFPRYEAEPTGTPHASGPADEFEDYSAGYSATTGEKLGPTGATEPPGGAGVDPHAAALSEPGMKERIQDTAGQAKHRAQQTASTLAAKASELGDQAREGAQRVKQRTAQATAHARDAAVRTGEQVAAVAREHPVETGLTCLALGLLAGTLAPTPQRVRDEVGPVAQRLKERARAAGQDVLQRGKRVVTAATEAARDEAQNQGLTPEAMLHREAASTGAGDQAPGASTMHGSPGERPPGDWPGQEKGTSPTMPAVHPAVPPGESRSTDTASTPAKGQPTFPPM